VAGPLSRRGSEEAAWEAAERERGPRERGPRGDLRGDRRTLRTGSGGDQVPPRADLRGDRRPLREGSRGDQGPRFPPSEGLQLRHHPRSGASGVM